LARTILEIVFQAKYLSEDPEQRAKLFMVHDERERLKMLKTADKYNDPSATDISDFIKTLKPSATALETWRNWWGENKNLRELAKSVLPEEVYAGQYSILSVLIHSAPPGSSFTSLGTGTRSKLIGRPTPQHRAEKAWRKLSSRLRQLI
jgi:uncharacterized protein DUF5677